MLKLHNIKQYFLLDSIDELIDPLQSAHWYPKNQETIFKDLDDESHRNNDMMYMECRNRWTFDNIPPMQLSYVESRVLGERNGHGLVQNEEYVSRPC